MVGKLILRGLLAGLIAGIIAFAFAYVFGEPSVDSAIAFEEQQSAAEAASMPGMDMTEEAPPVSRDTQKTIGLFTGIAIVSIGLGGLFSVIFAFANGRIGKLTSAQTAVLLAAICFVTVVLVPWLKYPASPPASTLDDTIGFRTSLYFLMLALSIVLTVAAVLVRQQLVPNLGQWNASVVTAIAYVIVVGIIFKLMPSVNEVPAGFPAQTFWDFRVSSMGIQALIWASLGVTFGVIVDRTIPQLSSHRTAVPAH